jgi:dolichyl-phosphate beta-glucosyltransferase
VDEQQPSDKVQSWIGHQAITAEAVALTIVVPAYNEQRRLPPTLIDIIDFCDQRNTPYEVIVVDDGSTDETTEVVRKFEKVRGQVRLIQLARNAGKGHAVRVGMLNSKGTRVLFADADGATPIAELTRLEAALDSGADVAIGSRAKASTNTRVDTLIHRKLLGRIFNKCVNLILLPGIEDTQCGFKLFTRPAAEFVFKQQRSDSFSFDVEILYLAQRVGMTIHEVPINWQNIPGSKVNLVLDALKMFRDIFRFRLVHRNVTQSSFIR